MIWYVCALTIMINLSDEPWNKHDVETKNRAKVTCKKVYKSCLKKFIKKEPRNYHAICGGKDES